MSILRKSLFLLFIASITACSCSNKKQDNIIYNNLENIHLFENYTTAFNDSNDIHLSVAQNIGITPMLTRDEIQSQIDFLELIDTNDFYKLDSLTHSIPYLVPKAKNLLDKIAFNFQDSLKSKKGYPHKIIVTSVLRTDEDIKKLRKRNGNSSEASAHSYGTTFDITYIRYEAVDTVAKIPANKLKTVLAEVLRDLKSDDLCYVKYEKKQGCFHITAR